MNTVVSPTRPIGPWPAPQVMSEGDGQRLVHMLRRDRIGGVVAQLIAAGSGEGTSTLIRDLALVAARLPGLRVLLLDFDPPGNAQLRALRGMHGVGVLGSEEVGEPGALVVHRLALGGLHVTEAHLPAGAASPELIKLLPGLQARFDLVLVDSPAIDRSYDGIILAPHVDTTLLVVEAEKTRSAVAQNLRDRIRDVGGAVGGVVLNKQRYYIPGFIYRHI